MSPLVEMAMGWVRSQIVDPPGADMIGDERRKEAAVVHRVLTGADGPALLEILAKTTVLRPALDPSLSGPASHDYAQRRTGENSVFATLIHLHDTHLKLTEGTSHGHHRPERPAPVFGWSAASDAAWRDANPGPGDGDAAPGFDPGGAIAFTG